MAYSVEDDTYIALYGVWPDEAQDDANTAWATDRMAEMEHLASGIQLADENLGRRPARFVTDAHLQRLDELRSRRDPDGRFHEWMGRPSRARRDRRELERYLDRPLAAPAPEVLAGDRAGPMSPADALALASLDRLLDPAPVAVETGWCTLPDGVGYVAARTPMPGGHRRDGRLVVRLAPARAGPLPHLASARPPLQLRRAAGGRRRASPHWGAVHHPVEDVGTRTVHARIAFLAPTAIGYRAATPRGSAGRDASSAGSSATTACTCATRGWCTCS